LATTAQPTDARSAWSDLPALIPSLAGALAFRFACYVAMTAMALWAGGRASAPARDALLEHLPYVPWFDRLNYWAWLGAYLPASYALLALEPRRWTRYMVTGGLVTLARGACIALTTLGAPATYRGGSGDGGAPFLDAYVALLSPLQIFASDAIRVHLSQDLFFSGHAATTFLLLLYAWHRPTLRWVALLGHVAMVASVLLAHMHYSIDVVGAWSVVFALCALREWKPREHVSAG
jgi:hypothetical protein